MAGLALRFDPRAALLPVAILLLVLLMVVPLPAVLLDLFFILNIGVSLIVLMVAINTRKPLDFSAFPTVLLFATLLRLSLNVASTRVVLVHGHEGTSAAGHVIEAFGAFLVGGDYVVGIFVFAVLMIINLVVITKGAGRVSEVAARFTLDALPGKQMAIDADLNAGLLTADEARARRLEVTTEADFHGSMDGASKFVKGDAVAGVLILAINIVGGLILGTVQHGLGIGEAARVYLLLAIGDGLVAQVPALLLSIAAAMVVTRVGSEQDLAGQVTSQFSGAGNWLPVAVILALLALLPGMPALVILPAAAGAGLIAWRLRTPAVRAVSEATEAAPTTIDWAEVSDTAAASLDIGFGLVPMVDEGRGAPLMARITGIRRQLSKALGFVLPPVRVRDDLALSPFAYRIAIGGVTVGEDLAFPDDVLAIEAGPVSAAIEGRPVTDPAFGLPARWIAPEEADLATAAGYTVVDAASVIGTHLNHLLSIHAHRLIGQDEVQALLDTLAEQAPALAGALVPKLLPLATVTGVFQRLVEEGVPVRDTRAIVSALVNNAARSPDPAELTEIIRPALGAAIVQTLAGLREPVAAIALDPGLEGLLANAVRAAGGSAWPFDPDLGARVGEAVSAAAAPLVAEGRRFAIVTVPLVRRPLWALLRVRLPQPVVLAFSEIPDDRTIDVVAIVGGADAAGVPGGADAAGIRGGADASQPQLVAGD
ncbi:flagellar biosynthesis protein FlhA [Polymorphobacter fuscus]|uniref:flagellar biosynthesis protein FlhA n=1 Tax=Sandarakinorhabdus fusca TaxID=1439888 RepID=UPI00142FAA87|nr:flagellar biosynthesis protein FlhA [Polymorphobacter fuscus]NJC07985.1 flagellar biosynthesis protein FlhA [Polymorphobacter fuscus]